MSLQCTKPLSNMTQQERNELYQEMGFVEDPNGKFKHGYYSSMDNMIGATIWRKQGGGFCTVTMVLEQPPSEIDPKTVWPDTIYVGPVTYWHSG